MSERFRLTLDFDLEPTREWSTIDQASNLVANVVRVLTGDGVFPDLVTFGPVAGGFSTKEETP